MSENEFENVLEVGTWLGRRQAFSLIAGRCSAADAKCLRELRESKKYKLLGLTWEECCKQRAGIGRSTADQIIQNLEEFGPDYFVIAQVTGQVAGRLRWELGFSSKFRGRNAHPQQAGRPVLQRGSLIEALAGDGRASARRPRRDAARAARPLRAAAPRHHRSSRTHGAR
jgi:hypothetical protein